MKLQQLEPAYHCTWLTAANDDDDEYPSSLFFPSLRPLLDYILQIPVTELSVLANVL